MRRNNDETLKKNEHKEIVKKLTSLKKINHRTLDGLFHSQHEKVFKKTNCLTCANCCKTTSPIFRDIDIKRISKRLGMKINAFITTYLRLDEENDYVLTVAPCPFLEIDNTCTIYEDRPLACKEYPHTNRKNMYQMLDLTAKNVLICPAVHEIVTTMEVQTKTYSF